MNKEEKLLALVDTMIDAVTDIHNSKPPAWDKLQRQLKHIQVEISDREDYAESIFQIFTDLKNIKDRIDRLSVFEEEGEEETEFRESTAGLKIRITLMEPEEYIEHSGSICPYCHSEDITIEGDTKFISATEFEQSRLCKTCDSSWKDLFSLTSFRKA